MCVCVCVCECMHVCVHACMCCACVSVCVHAHMHASARMCAIKCVSLFHHALYENDASFLYLFFACTTDLYTGICALHVVVF